MALITRSHLLPAPGPPIAERHDMDANGTRNISN
jgi:hypothetical protein